MSLPNLADDEGWWIAMVDLVPVRHDQAIISEGCVGAVGWVAAIAEDRAQAEDRIRRAVRNDGVFARSIEDVRYVTSVSEVEALDEHLAENISSSLEPGCVTVWGTLHEYLAEGEA